MVHAGFNDYVGFWAYTCIYIYGFIIMFAKSITVMMTYDDDSADDDARSIKHESCVWGTKKRYNADSFKCFRKTFPPNSAQFRQTCPPNSAKMMLNACFGARTVF